MPSLSVRLECLLQPSPSIRRRRYPSDEALAGDVYRARLREKRRQDHQPCARIRRKSNDTKHTPVRRRTRQSQVQSSRLRLSNHLRKCLSHPQFGTERVGVCVLGLLLFVSWCVRRGRLWPYPHAALFSAYFLWKGSLCEVLSGNVLREVIRMG